MTVVKHPVIDIWLSHKTHAIGVNYQGRVGQNPLLLPHIKNATHPFQSAGGIL